MAKRAPHKRPSSDGGILSHFSTADITKIGVIVGGLTGAHFWGQANNDTRAEKQVTTEKKIVDSTVRTSYQKRHETDSILEAHRWDSLFHIMDKKR